MSRRGHDTRNTYKFGLFYGPKGNRIYPEKKPRRSGLSQPLQDVLDFSDEQDAMIAGLDEQPKK